MNWRIGCVAAYFSLLGCVTDGSALSSAPPPRIEAVQPGDQRLSCSDLKAQMTKMDEYIADAQQANVDFQQRSASNDAVAYGSGFVPVPGLGMLASLGGTPRVTEAGNRMNRGEQAAERKEQLTKLYNRKNCP